MKIVVIAVSFTDTPWDGDVTRIRDVTMQRLPAYYQENSYGKLSMSVSVYGPYALPVTYGSANWYAEGVRAAEADVDFSQVDCIVLVPSGRIGGGGLPVKKAFATAEGTKDFLFVWVAARLVDAVIHEMGHTLGLHHANLLTCPGATAPLLPGSSLIECKDSEYADPMGTMGGGQGGYGHLNALQKDQMGWFAPGQIIEVTAPGLYTLRGLEGVEPPPTTTTRKRGKKITTITTKQYPSALKIRRNASDWLYLEYRRPVGLDTYLGSPYYHQANYISGPLLHTTMRGFNLNPSYAWDTDGGGSLYPKSRLLDPTPEALYGASSSYDTLALQPGMTFTDPGGAFTITTISAGGDYAVVDIRFTGPLDTTPPILSNFSPPFQSTVSGIIEASVDVAEANVQEVIFHCWNYATGTATPLRVLKQPPWTFQMDTTGISLGWLSIGVHAFDKAGNMSPFPNSVSRWDVLVDNR